MGKLLNRALRRYEGANIVIRLKARLFLLTFLAVLVISPIVTMYTIYSMRHDPVLGYKVNYALIASLVITLLFLVLVLVLLLKGRFSLSAHLLLIMTFASTWLVMFLDRSGAIVRLDSIVFIIGILTIIPLAVARHKSAILLYGAVNFAIFVVFAFYAKNQLPMPNYEFVDYLADSGLALLFVTFTAYSVFFINQRALDSMEDELAERRRQESAKLRLQEHLTHAQKMESVGRLAGGVAHDFNNLLTTIMGNTSLVMMKMDADSPANARLRDILKAAESASTLTKQLLAFSRKQVIEPRLIDLNRHIERSARMLARLINENIKTVLELGHGIGPILADPLQVEQIVINLVVNAGDAMPEGGTITIATRAAHIETPPPGTDPLMKPGDYAALSITDTGTGMAAEIIPHIFDPFFTTKPAGKGTGLGLASVYGAVSQNNGSIEVRSAPGRGSTMTAYFPIAADSTPALWPAPEAETLPQGSESILLAEDDPGVRTFVAMVLTSLGYRVYSAGDGDTTLAMAVPPGTKMDLLLADVILPDMTGPALAALAQKKFVVRKVLYMSGHAESVIVHRGIVDKGVNFIAKPFTALQIAKKVREVIDNK
jgi:signal transduction histidine kinase/CheY-like chemotaxis protein